MNMKKYSLLIGFMCAFSPVLPAGVLLTVIPAGGAVSGPAGGVVGWGFTLSNDADYAIVNSATMIGGDSLGKFTDFISANFVVIGPAPLGQPSFSQPSWTQGFDEVAQMGLGSFEIAAGALPGDTVAPTIQVSYDLFSKSPLDPDFNPDSDLLGTNNVSVDVSISVDAPATVPEPTTWMVVGAGLLVGFVCIRRQKRRVIEPHASAWGCF
jgi:hypothetical protein